MLGMGRPAGTESNGVGCAMKERRLPQVDRLKHQKQPNTSFQGNIVQRR